MIFTQPNNPLFLPSDLSSTILWLDSTDPLNSNSGVPPTNNSAVSQWKDKSRSGLLFQQATSTNQPKNINAFSNNRNMIYFGNNASSFLDSSTTFTVGNATSVSFVIQAPTLSGVRWIFETNGTAEFYIRLNNTQIQGAVWNGAADIGLIGATLTTNTTAIVTFTYSLTQSIMYVNGAQISSTTYGSTSPNNNVTHRIGQNGSASAPFNGYLGDFIIGNTVWTAAERQRIHLYLSSKWGIPVSAS